MKITTYARFEWDGEKYVLIEEESSEYIGPVELCMPSNDDDNDRDESSDPSTDSFGGNFGGGTFGGSGDIGDPDPFGRGLPSGTSIGSLTDAKETGGFMDFIEGLLDKLKGLKGAGIGGVVGSTVFPGLGTVPGALLGHVAQRGYETIADLFGPKEKTAVEKQNEMLADPKNMEYSLEARSPVRTREEMAELERAANAKHNANIVGTAFGLPAGLGIGLSPLGMAKRGGSLAQSINDMFGDPSKETSFNREAWSAGPADPIPNTSADTGELPQSGDFDLLAALFEKQGGTALNSFLNSLLGKEERV